MQGCVHLSITSRPERSLKSGVDGRDGLRIRSDGAVTPRLCIVVVLLIGKVTIAQGLMLP